MGLHERRCIKKFQDEVFPGQVKAIQEAAGFPVEVEAQFDTLMNHLDNADRYQAEDLSRFWTKIFCEPAVETLSTICADEMGKEALKESLNKIVFCNVKGNFSPHSAISFDDGVLTIDHKVANTGEVKQRAQFAVGLLEKAL